MSGLCNHSLELTGLAGDPSSPAHRLDPRAKIAGLLTVIVVAVSASVSQWPVFVACAAVLVLYAAVARVGAGDVWRRVRYALPLVVAVAAVVPFVRRGGAVHELGPLTVHDAGLEVLAGVAAKATIGTASAALLTTTTAFPAVLRGFEALRAPRVMVLIAGFMYRYVFVIVEEVARMRAALVSRGYRPRHLLQAWPAGRVAGALFLRSYGRGERVHQAMLARGYAGTMPVLEPLAFRRVDGMFVIAVVVALLGLRVLVALS